MIGEWIGPYRIEETIGQGGMSSVYRAHQSATGGASPRDVAIKVLPRQMVEDSTFLKRFQREAQVLARLDHPSIVPILDYGEHDGMPYIVMRLMKGGTLRRRLFYEGIDLATAVRVIEQVAEALDYAHAQGVIHRDLKPSNILLDENDNACLTDFGIAKMLGSASQVTGSGVVGTPNYMSPEQCQGKPLGPASDIYALGAILFEILTGEAPYEADTPLAVMYMHVKDPVPSARERNPELPPQLDRVVARAMAKRPEDRYPSARALAADLRRVAEEVYGSAALASPPAPPATEMAHPTPPELRPAARSEGPLAGIPAPPSIPEWYTPEDAGVYGVSAPSRGAGWLALAGGAAALVLLLGAAGLGLSMLTHARGGGGALAPTLPPTRTPGEPAASPRTPIADLPTVTPVTPQGAGEPTGDFTATATLPGVTPSVMPVLATATPILPTVTRLPATATAAVPTATSLPPTVTATASSTLTPTLTLTASPTLTATSPPPPGAGLLVYVEGFGASAEIVVVDANGGNRRQLTSNGYYDGEPDWSWDGTRIAFDSSPAGGRDIYTMTAAGGDVRQITSAAGDERHPDWSPDGSRIAYETGEGNTSEIWVVNADGTGNTRITDNSYGDRAPQFSPDGTQIAFMTNQRGKWEIAIMSYPAAQVVKIFDCPVNDCRFPSWSADGTYIAYNTLDSSGNVAEIWEVNVSSGVSSVLVSGRDNGRPVYARDGRYLYYNGTADGNTDLYRIDVNTLQIVRVTTGATNDYAPDWGPG